MICVGINKWSWKDKQLKNTFIFVLKMHHVCVRLLTRIPFYLECALTQTNVFLQHCTKHGHATWKEKTKRVLHELISIIDEVDKTHRLCTPSEEVGSWDMKLQDGST